MELDDDISASRMMRRQWREASWPFFLGTIGNIKKFNAFQRFSRRKVEIQKAKFKRIRGALVRVSSAAEYSHLFEDSKSSTSADSPRPVSPAHANPKPTPPQVNLPLVESTGKVKLNGKGPNQPKPLAIERERGGSSERLHIPPRTPLLVKDASEAWQWPSSDEKKSLFKVDIDSW